MLAGLEMAVAGSRLRAPDVVEGTPFAASVQTAQQSGQQLIAPSMALSIALRYSPGSQGLDVALVQGGRPIYAVKLKTGNRVHRVLVDAQTGQVVGQ